MPYHGCCCVIGCGNTWRNSEVKYFHFPTSKNKWDQRIKWIQAVKRCNIDGSQWIPRLTDRICSAHFINNIKSNNPSSPSYAPKIFPEIYKKKKVNSTSIQNRYKRWVNRSVSSKNNSINNSKPQSTKSNSRETNIEVDNSQCVLENQKIPSSFDKICALDDASNNSNQLMVPECQTRDASCQVYFSQLGNSFENTFVCNRYIFPTFSDAETQTDLNVPTKVIVHTSDRKQVDKSCGTPSKEFSDKTVGADENEICNGRYFTGILSVKTDEQLIDLAGTTFENLDILLRRMPEIKCRKVDVANRLLIFLMKLKTGITYSALAVLFCVHRTTISEIFLSTLEHLCSATREFVFWPSKLTVLGSMPDCFKPEFENVRVIIDCTEFRIEVPSRIDNRVWCYSHYKKGFTAKVLIGITPNGFISFKSAVFGGRKPDSQITVDSGLLDLLEDDDEILADKGFPEIKSKIDEKGKRVLVVMPPFLEKKSRFSKEDCESTYNIARVRIHVERIMQRLRLYNILNKIPEHLFQHLDNIIHMCSVLVNLQPPIIADLDQEDE